jgi:hypothetical protein
MTIGGSSVIPIERYISHVMFEVPFPSVHRPLVLMQMDNEVSVHVSHTRIHAYAQLITFDSHDDSQLPLAGAFYIDFLKNGGVDNCMYMILLALLEHKILVHSLRPWLLTSTAETVKSLLFPFQWQLPYIPLCPLSRAGIVHAPMAFLAGVDSQYFELYDEPPRDVTCVDLDTNTISNSDVRRVLKLKVLPHRPAKLLRQTLEMLHKKAHQHHWR